MIALVRAVQARADGLAAHAPGLAIDIDDHRRGAAIEHRVDGRGEGEVGHDHLVARADAERDQREMQRHGAVRDGDAVADADEAAEVFLELVDVGALARNPSGDERVEHGAEVVARHHVGIATWMGRVERSIRTPVRWPLESTTGRRISC